MTPHHATTMARGRDSEYQGSSHLQSVTSPLCFSSPPRRQRRYPRSQRSPPDSSSHRHASDVQYPHHRSHRSCSSLIGFHEVSSPPPPRPRIEKPRHEHELFTLQQTSRRLRSRSRSLHSAKRLCRGQQTARDDYHHDQSSGQPSPSRNSSHRSFRRGLKYSREAGEYSDSDHDVTDDFYRPATSNGYAPGDNPRKRGVRESDGYRPKPVAHEETASIRRRRATDGYATGDTPSSRGVQETDRYRPKPPGHEQRSATNRSSDSQEALPAHARHIDKPKTQSRHPVQILGSMSAVSTRFSARPLSSIPNFDDGKTLFSFADYDDLEHPPQSSKEKSRQSKVSESGVKSFCHEDPHDRKQPSKEDPGATQRLFGGIIKRSRSPEANTANPHPLSQKLSHDSKTIAPYRIAKSSSPSLASQHGLPQGFEIARSGTQQPPMPDHSGHQNAALASINPNAQPKFQASPFPKENVSTPKPETAWQRMIRESDDRWKMAGG